MKEISEKDTGTPRMVMGQPARDLIWKPQKAVMGQAACALMATPVSALKSGTWARNRSTLPRIRSTTPRLKEQSSEGFHPWDRRDCAKVVQRIGQKRGDEGEAAQA